MCLPGVLLPILSPGPPCSWRMWHKRGERGRDGSSRGEEREGGQTQTRVLGSLSTPPGTLIIGHLGQAAPRELPRTHAAGMEFEGRALGLLHTSSNDSRLILDLFVLLKGRGGREGARRRHTGASVLGSTPRCTLIIGRLSEATPRELPRKHAAGVGSRMRQGVQVGTLASPVCHPCSLGSTLGEPWGR